MNKNLIMRIAAGLMVVFAISLSAQTPVAKHGKLSTSGGYLLDQNNNIVQLRGMSFYWSTPAWPGYKYYNAATINALVDSWKCTVVRIAYDRNNGNDNGWDGVKTVLDASIAKGIYAIIDWHSHTAQNQQAAAVSFFTQQAQAYKNVPNVIFEPYNEPITFDGSTLGTTDVAVKTWAQIKPYFQAVLQAIRDQGAENLIIVGTPFYSQFVGVAAGDPPKDKNGKPFTNIAYAFHFYSASHGPYGALVKGTGKGGMEDTYLTGGGLGQVPVFITEWGTTDNLGGEGGNNTVDEANTNWWFNGNSALGPGGGYVNGKYHLSWCNWSVSDFQASSAFTGGSTAPNLNPSTSGAIVKRLLSSESTDTYPNPAVTGQPGPAIDTVFPMPATLQFYRYNRYSGGGLSTAAVSFSSRDTVDKRTATQALTVSANGNWISFFMNFSSATNSLYVRYLLKSGTAAADVFVNSTKVGSLNFASGTYWQTIGLNATIPSGKDTVKFVFTSVPTSGFSLEWLSNLQTGTVSVLHKFNFAEAKVFLVKTGFAVNLPVSHGFTSYSLIGADGRVFKKSSINRGTNEMQFNNLSNGVWFLKLEGANGNRLYKAVVSR